MIVFSDLKPSVMKKFLFPLVLIVFSCYSCNFMGGERIKGNGTIKSENRSVSNFNGIKVSGNADIYVKQDAVYSVRIETDENLMEHIITELDGAMLDIHPRENSNLKPTRSIKVYVSGPAFSSFIASGACNIIGENKITSTASITFKLSGAGEIKMDVMAPLVDADLSGAGSISLSGQVRDFKVDGSGATDIKCFDLLTENTTVELSGAGDAEVFASVKLDVDISGAADVKYKGNAAISQKVSGAGSVKKVD